MTYKIVGIEPNEDNDDAFNIIITSEDPNIVIMYIGYKLIEDENKDVFVSIEKITISKQDEVLKEYQIDVTDEYLEYATNLAAQIITDLAAQIITDLVNKSTEQDDE